MANLGLEPDTADLSLAEIAQLSQALALAMRNAQAGDVAGPVELDDPRNENGWILARVIETTSGGLPEFSEFRGVIVQRLQAERLAESVVEGLRSQAYVDIRLGGG